MKDTVETIAFDVLAILQRLRKDDVRDLVRSARRFDAASDIAIRWLVSTAIKADEFDKLPLSVRAYAIDIIDPDSRDARRYRYNVIHPVMALLEQRAPFSVLELSLAKPLQH